MKADGEDGGSVIDLEGCAVPLMFALLALAYYAHSFGMEWIRMERETRGLAPLEVEADDE